MKRVPKEESLFVRELGAIVQAILLMRSRMFLVSFGLVSTALSHTVRSYQD